jgi:type I restriction enzyme S subunit
VHFSPRPFWPIDTVYYVVSLAKDDLRFLHHLLDYLPLDVLNAATGVPGLSRRDAYALRGVFPPFKEQFAIARLLDAVDTVLERTHVAVGRAREVKRALVQRLFTEGLRGQPQKRTAIGFIPQSWAAVPVSSVVTSFQYGLSVPMEQKGAIPILRMGNIQRGEVLLDELKYVSLPQKCLKPYIVKRGDVLFNRTNSQEHVGKVGIYRHDVSVVFASYLIRLLPDPSKVDHYYLGHVLNSYSAQCRIKRYATPGVQQVNINATNLGKVLIPLAVDEHGLDEQREIATILENADAAIRGYQLVIKAQQALKAALMQDLLTGSVRVNNNLEAVLKL